MLHVRLGARGPGLACSHVQRPGLPRLQATATRSTPPCSRQHRLGLAVRATASPDQEERLVEPETAAFDTSESSSAQQQLTATPPAWVSSPALLVASLAGFAAVTADLYAPFSQRWLFTAVDQPIHEWVVRELPPVVRDLVANFLMSNSTIALGCAGWALCTALLLNSALDSKAAADPAAKKLTLQRLALAWATYVSAGGFFIPGDNLLIRSLKHAFARVRPSANHHTFSFPSGHTAAATFTVGLLLFALLPWLLERAEAQRRAAPPGAKQPPPGLAGLQRAGQCLVAHSGKVWLGSVGLTIAGRVLGDAHWLTDTLAAACVSAALVSGFLLLCQRLERADAAES